MFKNFSAAMAALSVSLLVVPLGPLHADDGVIEINQAVAEAGGILPGDTAGFPVTLTEAGSYRLTSNLDDSNTASPASTHLIEIQAPNVSLDLNGFTVQSNTRCSGKPLSCTGGGGPYDGIHAAANARETSIRNGTVYGASRNGIYCEATCRVQQLVAHSNGASGILIVERGVISTSSANENFNWGIDGQNISVSSCSANKNRLKGFSLAGMSRLVDSQALDNEGDGAYIFGGVALNNVISGNGGTGLFVDSRSGWGGNVLTDNTTANVDGTGLQLSTNLCGTTACP